MPSKLVSDDDGKRGRELIQLELAAAIQVEDGEEAICVDREVLLGREVPVEQLYTDSPLSLLTRPLRSVSRKRNMVSSSA